MEISKRRMESLMRAEDTCRELRYQLANNGCSDNEIMTDFICHWLTITRKEKFTRPDRPKHIHSQRIRNMTNS